MPYIINAKVKQKTPFDVFCGTYVVNDKYEYHLTLTLKV